MMSHGSMSHVHKGAMISMPCTEKRLIRNQLLSKGTRHFRAIALASIDGRRMMRGANEVAPAARESRLPRGRAHPPIQGHARAHRSPFEQMGQRQPEGVLLELMRRDNLNRHGVGVWAMQPTAVILAVLGVGV